MSALLREVVGCRRCLEDKTTFINGQSVLKSPWVPPRGWAGSRIPEIVFVALNPGAPLPGEMPFYTSLGLGLATRNPSNHQVRGLTQYVEQQYTHPRQGQNWVFHRKSVAYARALLWLKDRRDPGTSPWERCWFTDMFKCSTRRESSPALSRAAVATCSEHLTTELKLLKPALVIALGGRVERALGPVQKAMPGLSIVKFRHPSNGCPRLEASHHDRAFEDAAYALGVRVPSWFRTVRAKVQAQAFP